jgi:hypothetical protein
MKDVLKFSFRREAHDSASYQPNLLGGNRALPLRLIGLVRLIAMAKTSPRLGTITTLVDFTIRPRDGRPQG